MKVSDIVAVSQRTFLRNIKRDEPTMLAFVNLGLEELNRKFSFNIRAVVIKTIPEKLMYELVEPDFNLLLDLYDNKGKVLVTSDVIDNNSDYKLLSYNSFILTNPREEFITCIYKASMKEMTSYDDELPIPPAFHNALLDYIAFLGHSTNVDNFQETNFRLAKFNSTCEALISSGYSVDLYRESRSIIDRGFV